MPDASHTTLREQVENAIWVGYGEHYANPGAADRVIELIAERERVLRLRIEALGHPNDSLRRAEALADVLAVFDA